MKRLNENITFSTLSANLCRMTAEIDRVLAWLEIYGSLQIFTVRRWLVKVESKRQERWRKWNLLYWCRNLWILPLPPLENLAVTHVESHNGVFQEADTVFECEVRLGRRRENSRCRRGAELEYWIHYNRDSSKFHYSLFKANINLSVSVLSTGVCFKASDWCQKLNRIPVSAGITADADQEHTCSSGCHGSDCRRGKHQIYSSQRRRRDHENFRDE